MNHASIISLWPSLAELAHDVDAALPAVRKWKQRGRIPPRYWPTLSKTEIAKQQRVSIEELAQGATEDRAA